MSERINMTKRCCEEVLRHPGLTTWELAEVTQISYWVLERRLPALRNSGRVRNGDRRRCRIKGRPCQTWLPQSFGPKADAILTPKEPPPLPSERPPVDPAVIAPVDPQVEQELQNGCLPMWITRAIIEDTKKFWSPRYGYALSDREAIEILINVTELGKVLMDIERRLAPQAPEAQEASSSPPTPRLDLSI